MTNLRISTKSYIILLTLLVLLISGLTYLLISRKPSTSQNTFSNLTKEQTLTGTYTCVPNAENTIPQQEGQCVVGIKTNEGAYYALDFSALAPDFPSLQEGDSISVVGDITPREYVNDELDVYDIAGSMAVTQAPTKL